MRTTIELPEPLFRQIKQLALQKGESLKVLITRALDRELTIQQQSPIRCRNPLPSLTVPSDAPILSMSPQELAENDVDLEVERFLGRGR